ncbi:Ribonuclease H superfamily [Sesbania bispinosa]|nr:Ribonuclease H superfamily [Sesbania bispinosa]
MKRLRLLQLAGVQLDGDFEYLSRNLKWLCWHGFSLEYIPTNFYQGNLVSVELENSNVKLVWKEAQTDSAIAVKLIQESFPPSHPCRPLISAISLLKGQWEVIITHTYREANTAADWMANYAFNFPYGIHILDTPPVGISNLLRADRMEKLKILNLSHSHHLTQTPDFSNMPNLEKLVLTDCPSLSEVSYSIGHLNEVLLINLKDCISLRKLPRSIYSLKSLKTLILSGCLMIDKLEEDFEQMESLTTLIADKTAITRVPFSVVRSKSIGYISLCGYEGFSRDVFPSIIRSWMSPTNNLSSLVQTSAGMSSLVSLNIPNSGSHDLSSISKDLPKLRSLWVECGSELQLSRDVARILDALYATNSTELKSTATTSQNMTISGCDVTLLPSDNYPDWLAFDCEGSSVTFEVPRVNGRSLKTMMCIVHYSTPDDITSDGLKNVLVINYTKTIIQLYKRDTLASFENDESERVVSNIEPGNKVKVAVVFENGIIVKKTTIYLIYEEAINGKMEHCYAADKNEIIPSGDENEHIVSRICPQVESTDDFKQKQKRRKSE